MRTTLETIFTAARAQGCPIIHISMLAGEAPFVASTPCLGNGPAPLLAVAPGEYLGVMNELRNALVVEYDQTLPFAFVTGGGRDRRSALRRVQLSPRMMAGRLDVAWGPAALYYLMDSAGQETSIIYDGLNSFAEIGAHRKRRAELCRARTDNFAAFDDDVRELCGQLDRTVSLDEFDLDAFAGRRGLTAIPPYVQPAGAKTTTV